MKEYDIMVVGPVSLDHNIDYLGNERKEVGGAVVASGFAAAGSGAKTAIFCKSNAADADVKERFAGVNADLYWAASKATCSIRNQYFTADKEKRACTSMGVCDPFRFEELPQVKTKVYHFAGLVYGDFDGALLTEAAKHGKVGLDVQCMLRHVEPDKSMAFHDWAEKKELLPLTGYVHGGCSPVGMKKQFPTVFHETVELFDTICVSAGKIGAQVEVAPADLIALLGAQTADVTAE